MPVHVDAGNKHRAADDYAREDTGEALADSEELVHPPEQAQSSDGDERTEQHSDKDGDALLVALPLNLHAFIMRYICIRWAAHQRALVASAHYAACAVDAM